MTGIPSSVDRDAAGEPDAKAAAELPEQGEGKRGALLRWLWPVPAIVGLAMGLWGIGTPAYTLDEASTLSAVRRPFGDLLDMLVHIDAVHGLYYVILWPLVRFFGPGELVTRAPSAVAMAVAAVAIFGLGQRLLSTRAGLAASLIFAVLPEINYYGQTARPYAMAVALAAIASYLLVRAMQACAGGGRVRGWLAGYGACFTVLGYIHMFALLVAAAHAVPVATTWLRHRGTGRRLAVGWVIAVIAGFALVSPLIELGLAQRGVSMNWEKATVGHSVASLIRLVGPQDLAVLAAAVIAAGIVVSATGGLWRPRGSGGRPPGWQPLAHWPPDLVALCVPWLILPPALLIAASAITPLFDLRYVMFCVPAVALLLGAALDAFGWIAGAAVLAGFAAFAMPTVLAQHSPTGHGSDFRLADQIIARNSRPGDALMYDGFGEPVEMAYPYGMGQLRNVQMAKSPMASDSIGGTRAAFPVVQHSVDAALRIWYVQLTYGKAKDLGQEPGLMKNVDYKPTRQWRLPGIWVTLYTHW